MPIASPLIQLLADGLWIESQPRPRPATKAYDAELVGVLVYPGTRHAQMLGDFAHGQQIAAAVASGSDELGDPACDRLDR
jgi:hypothetical protein